ncbi:MAG TPA: TonB family protein [Bacteroidia bacterium]|jgi:protein TonB
MKTLFNSEKNFNELIFENRNKDYGAYAIRSSHNNTLARSMTITTLGISVLLALLVYLNKNSVSASPLIDVDLPAIITEWHEIIIPQPEKPKELPVEQNDPLPPKTDNLNLTVTDKKEPLDVKPVELMNVGDKTVKDGTDSAFADPVTNIPASPAPSNNIEIIVSEMPEFNGDVYAFIKQHMRYPQVAVENGTQGTVGLSFVIEKDGSIGDINVLGRVGDGCTEEAIRVIRMMPKWKPGKNKGELVRVMFNLPIKFRLK